MKYKFIKHLASIIVFLLCASYYTPAEVFAFETTLFSINLPNEFVTYMNQNRENDDFTFAFIEGNKERKKSILLVITGERINDADLKNKDLGLLAATKALRDVAIKSECKGSVSDISNEVIGNTKSLFFKKTNRGCIVLVEKYWSAITNKYFISFYLAMPENGDQKIFEEAQKSIKYITFKDPMAGSN